MRLNVKFDQFQLDKIRFALRKNDVDCIQKDYPVFSQEYHSSLVLVLGLKEEDRIPLDFLFSLSFRDYFVSK